MTSHEPPSPTESVSRDASPPGAAAFGMLVLLVSLSALFAALLVIYLIIRSRAHVWPPPGMPALPPALWGSTGILLAASGAMYWAVASARRDNGAPHLRAALALAVLLSFSFIANQGFVWLQLIRSGITAKSNLYAFGFYLLSGLHGAHAVAGIIFLLLVTRSAFRAKTPAAILPALRHCATYWHFLDATWIVLFFVVFILR